MTRPSSLTGGSALGLGATLNVDAGGGLDMLQADFSSLDAISFQIGPQGKVKLGTSSFTNFESYFLILGAGSDKVRLAGGDDTVVAGDGNDELGGGGGNDVLLGGEGNDIINGGAGDDVVAGQGGRNVLLGGDGDDYLESQGVDQVDGGSGTDNWSGIFATATQDLKFTFNGAAGTLSNGATLTNVEAVNFESGSGNDTASISGSAASAGPPMMVRLGTGYDQLDVNMSNGVTGSDRLTVYKQDGALGGLAGSITFDGVEELSLSGDKGDTARLTFFDVGSGAFEDGLHLVVQADGTLTSNVGVTLYNYSAFRLQLTDTNDSVVGGAGRDSINAMGGDDLIAGGAGGDDLRGGSGADVFWYRSLDDFGTGTGRVDGILDFVSADGDKIDFRDVIAGEFAFVGTDDFSGQGTAELRTVDLGEGFFNVFGDVDGDGVADFRLVVATPDPLTSSDFFL